MIAVGSWIVLKLFLAILLGAFEEEHEEEEEKAAAARKAEEEDDALKRSKSRTSRKRVKPPQETA